MDGHKKIDQLEKLKLMEILELDEDTFIRFFKRHSEYKAKLRNRMDEQDDKLDKMEVFFKSSKALTNKEYEGLLQEYIDGEEKMVEDREIYLKSLQSILTPEQICKLVVFEKRFRDEIRDILFKDRMRMKKGRDE
jgi:hypothetical protein